MVHGIVIGTCGDVVYVQLDNGEIWKVMLSDEGKSWNRVKT